MSQIYIGYDFKVSPLQPGTEILIAELGYAGFESFVETEEGVSAYIQKEEWNDAILEDIDILKSEEFKIEYTFSEIEQVNWNEEWEKNFSPINVEDQVSIRAEFHENQNLAHEIIIQPKMSFGTGHHATTYLMIQQMLDMYFENKTVLDMGCGTSVLAIFAKQQGAGKTVAIDIDEWSVENSIENAARNNVRLEISQGTAENLGNENFDIILANINRNILISDIPTYVSVLNTGGQLLLSGLCFFDVDDILEVCTEQKLTLKKQIQREEWVSLLLEK